MPLQLLSMPATCTLRKRFETQLKRRLLLKQIDNRDEPDDLPISPWN
jgi:hypothetical protein